MVVKARKCYVTHSSTTGVFLDKDTNPECPECHGEMMPAMGAVKKGEMRRIEQNWECEACGKIVT
jgi:predicted CXXCH cytochrome family protein